MEIISDFIWYWVDFLTTKLSNYIKYKELEKRLKL